MSLTRLRVRGPFRGPSGYDHHVREFVRALHSRGIELELIDLPEWGPVDLPEELRDRWFEELRAPVDAPVMLHFAMPHQVDVDPGRANVIYSMFEGTRVHTLWIGHSLKHDLVIVPTESSREAWVRSGMPADRIAICPLGVNPTAFDGSAEPLPLRGAYGERLSHYRVRFLNLSEISPRKNLVGLLRAWMRATLVEDDTVLIMKLGAYAPGSKARFENQIRSLEGELGRPLADAAPVHFIYELFRDQDMPRLFASASHYISMSFGEGWDQPMVEAAASGLRLIAPDHSAYRAYLDASVAGMIPCREIPVRFDTDASLGELFANANWWLPDEDAAVEHIRNAITGKNEDLPSPRDRIIAELTWAQATDRLLTILDEVAELRSR